MEARTDMTPAAELGARFRFALGLVDAGLELMRCNLRRRHPEADEARIQDLLNTWLLERQQDSFSDRPWLVPRRSGTAP